jgi:Flp pilus assembly protein CpaB
MTMPTLSRNIVISVALAIAAAAALILYTKQVQDSASSGGAAVRVVVATHDVSPGTRVDDAISAGDLSYRTVRASDVVSGAYTSLDAARGQVLTQPLYPGDQLTASRTGSSRDLTVAGRVTGLNRGFILPFDPNSGALGAVQQGDRIDVMATYTHDGKATTYVVAAGVTVMQVMAPDSTGAVQGVQNEGALMLQVTEAQAVGLANALAVADNAPLSSSKTIWVAIAGSHGATWEKLPPFSLPGKFPTNGVPAPAK